MARLRVAALGFTEIRPTEVRSTMLCLWDHESVLATSTNAAWQEGL